MKQKKKLCLPRQTPDPRKRIEIELQAKIDARLAAEDAERIERSKRAVEVEAEVAAESNTGEQL
jgi:hypothetical protein